MSQTNQTQSKTEPKRNEVIASDVSNGRLVIECKPLGQKIIIDASVMAQFGDDLNLTAALFGYQRKIVNAAAISRTGNGGKSASPKDKWDACMAVLDRLQQGQWNADRTGGESAGSYLLRAMMELKPNKSRETIETWLKAKSTAERAAMELNPQVKPIIDRMKAAKADSEFDSDAAIDELDDMEE